MAVRRKINTKKPAPTPGTKVARKGRAGNPKKRITQKAWAEEIMKIMETAPPEMSPTQIIYWAEKKMKSKYRLQTRKRT